MSAVLEPRTMGRAKGRPKTSTRDDVSVKIDRELVDKAKIIVAHEDSTLAELLSELLREPIDERFLKVLRELEAKGKRPKGPR